MFGFSKIGLILAGIALALVATWGGIHYVKEQKAVALAAQMQVERDAAGAARDKAIEVSKANEVTIQAAKQEKIDIETSLAALETKRKADAIKIGQLSAIIKNQAANPANQVKLSPVLQDLIAQIQADRKIREAK